MRLLFVIDSFQSGGAQRQMVSLACALHQRGHEVEFFVYFPHLRHYRHELEELGITIHSTTKRYRFSLRVLAMLRSHIRSGKFDGVLSFLTTPNVYAELAAVMRGRPVLVVSERGPFAPESSPWFTYLVRQLHRLADHVTVNSHHQCKLLESTAPWLRGRVSTIYNGVDLNRFEPTPMPTTSRATLRLIVVGTVCPHKNYQKLIQSLAVYRETHHELPIMVSAVGAHSLSGSTDSSFAEADALLSRLDLRQHWSWLGERTDIAALLASHDALVHPSVREGMSNAVCEALAAGRPVLASRGFDHPRIIEDGVCGFLFEPTDPADIAQAMRRLCRLPLADRQQMGAAARHCAEREFGLDRLVDNYVELFSRLM
jgi:glycosyltransferase involved in cell wall biosynthesis